MREERLLERIHNLEDPTTRAGLLDQAIAIRSVVLNLNRILNTRQGSVLMDPLFGISDLSSMASRFSTESPETLEDIVASVARAVEHYEQRLSNAKLRLMEKKDYEVSLTLELEAMFKTQQGDIPLTFKINVTPEGRTTVTAT